MKNKETILFLSDIPPCKNYTGGIMNSQLIRFLLEEKQTIYYFCIMSKCLVPEIEDSIKDNIKFSLYNKPEENFQCSKIRRYKYYVQLRHIEKNLIKYIKNNGITKIICPIQGETLTFLLNSIRKKFKIDYLVQIWDPIEWWIKENNFSFSRKEKVLKEFNKVMSDCFCCMTTSDIMNKEYEKKYNIRCVKVMPPLENNSNFQHLNYKRDDQKFVISMAGQTYAKDTILSLLNALDDMNWNYNNKEIIFNHYGNWCVDDIDLKKYNENGVKITTTGFLPQNRLLQELSKSDLTYCPYFFSKDLVYKKVAKFSFPSKLVTYLSLNVLTLLHAPNYSSPIKFLKDKKVAYIIETIETKEIIKKLKQIMDCSEEEKRSRLKKQKKLFEENFDYSVVKKSFFEALKIDYLATKKLKILEVNNVDLPGKRFNGYDLQETINKDTIHIAKQIVTHKTSTNKNVIKFYKSNYFLEKEYKLIESEANILSVHSNLSFTSNILKNNDYFIHSDLVHYHLIHNTKLSLYQMIDLCKNKPSIITIHDPWIFTGRCVSPQECEKWINGCKKCQYLDNLFPLKEDNCNSLWKLKRNVYKNLDIDFIVTTPFMLDMFKKSPLTKNIKNVHMIPFGIDLNKFSNSISKEEARKKLNINNEDIVLFFRAQMAMKGTEYIIEALKLLKTNKKITLLTCSETGLLKELKEKYKIVDLGHVEDDKIITAYNACDIFLMPSRSESFGLMAIEAMACSRPVVVFDNSALPYVTFAPKCGVLVKNKDSYDLMKNIKKLIDDKKERERIGFLGRQLAEKHYDLAEYNKKIIQLYEKAYKRQKEKIQMSYNENQIDCNLSDVQTLIKKLRLVYFKIFGNYEIDNEFNKYRKNDIITTEKVDYSLTSIQNLIQKFNDFIYFKLKEQEQNFTYSKDSLLSDLKPKIKILLRKNKILYFLAKSLYKLLKNLYKVLRRIKRIVFNDYYKLLNANFEHQSYTINSLTNQINTQKEEFENQIEKLLIENNELKKQINCIKKDLNKKLLFIYKNIESENFIKDRTRKVISGGKK